MEFARKGYYRQMQLIGLIAHKKLNPKFDLGAYLAEIDPDGFYFISQKYFSSYYYYAHYLNNGDLAHLKKAKDRKSTRLNSSHVRISYAVFCLKKKKKKK